MLKFVIALYIFFSTSIVATATGIEFVAPNKFVQGESISYMFTDTVMVVAHRNAAGTIVDCYPAAISQISPSNYRVHFLDSTASQMTVSLQAKADSLQFTVIEHNDENQIGWVLNMRRRNIPDKDLRLLARVHGTGALIQGLTGRLARFNPQSIAGRMNIERMKRLESKLQQEQFKTMMQSAQGWIELDINDD